MLSSSLPSSWYSIVLPCSLQRNALALQLLLMKQDRWCAAVPRTTDHGEALCIAYDLMEQGNIADRLGLPPPARVTDKGLHEYERIKVCATYNLQ